MLSYFTTSSEKAQLVCKLELLSQGIKYTLARLGRHRSEGFLNNKDMTSMRLQLTKPTFVSNIQYTYY